jgi:ABC-type nitrate/sulfonate/bicarbonate transport system substrate-binding protein
MKNLLKKQKLLMPIVTVLIVTVIVSLVIYLYQAPVIEMKNVSVGLFTLSESQSLVFVAIDQNFFAKNGINLTTKTMPSSPLQINATLNNDIDIGSSSEFTFVSDIALKERNLSIIASINRLQSYAITARTDTGIENPEDLAGKRIGLVLQTTSEYYLCRFLEAQGLNRQDVTLVNLQPAQYVDSIVNGTVDAVVLHSRIIHNEIQMQLGDSIITWPAQGVYSSYLSLIGRNDWIKQHPDIIVQFLRALSMAEDYINNNPDSAKAIVEKHLNRTVTQESWLDYRFSLSLEQSLISIMQNQARWLIERNLTNVTQVPDFLDYVYLDGLKSIRPQSVNIIG